MSEYKRQGKQPADALLPEPDFETHTRLARKAIATAREFGEELSVDEAYERTAENWIEVVAMAEEVKP